LSASRHGRRIVISIAILDVLVIVRSVNGQRRYQAIVILVIVIIVIEALERLREKKKRERE
jgi:hypothetical protein